MKPTGFPPGEITFRLAIMIIIMAILWIIFLNYTVKISEDIEKASIQQTKRIIDSSLMVVFANYAVKGDLDRLNELVGTNPFNYLAEYQQLPSGYRGEVEGGTRFELEPGWYFDKLTKEIIYKAYYSDQIYLYSVVLDYRDVNGSGRFESGIDDFRRLSFYEIPQQ